MRAVHTANAAPLHRFLLRLVDGRQEAAEDLFQETMLRAWRNLDELPPDGDAQRRWLFRVARNLAIDALRARQARPPEVGDLDPGRVPVAADVLECVLDRQLLDDALRRLSPEHRTVLVRLYYEDASVADVAASTGVPEGTVRSRSYYALRTVREFLERAGGRP
ncbi:RNA polymerase sigma factor SigL [Virgisporangium aliadipatigenens]|uniref:RNA polymerase sigma factor SigL n=2 Tax=Virgisporangium aliadipatigenens TaxID=741659 RepID=A0A8J3YI40_9ACTN|nr:RNA polymerase sigma factor SigL [Virgisporangium aliadipatigenens]